MDGNLESFSSFLYENYFILGQEMWFNITFFLQKQAYGILLIIVSTIQRKKKGYIWDIFTVTPLKGKTWAAMLAFLLQTLLISHINPVSNFLISSPYFFYQYPVWIIYWLDFS